MNPRPRWMIYGANGFTGRLIAWEARRRGLTPVLAGRSGDALRPLAGELGLEGRVFDLETPGEVTRNLEDVSLVLHCAGPFSRTQRPLLAGCLATGTHYLDITGESAALEYLHGCRPEARRAGITAVAGVGFDVVPTDGLGAPLLRLPAVRRVLGRLARRVTGPTERQMRQGRTVVWGEVTDRAGGRRTAKLLGPEAYRFTAESALAAVERLLVGDVLPGTWTPSQAFGAAFVTTLPGVEVLLDHRNDDTAPEPPASWEQ